MRIAFFNIPAHGHTNPTLGVVRELTGRGHQVRYYSYEPFRAALEAAGAEFIPCDRYGVQPDLAPEDSAKLGSDIALSTRVLADTTLAMDETVCRELREWQPDCIVADSMAIWGRLAAQKLGVPFVSSTTTFAFNRYSSRIMKQSAGDLVRMLLSLPAVNRQVRRLRQHGYPVRNMLDIIASDENTHTIVYTSPEFQPCAETFPPCFSFVGPSLRPATETVEKTCKKLVYISMGTVNNDLLPLYRSCIEALGDTDCQVILSAGQQADLTQLEPLPENISVFPRVDQMAVLEKADVFLSHCGMNSVSESLYFGVPLVLLPQTPEQSGVALRAEQLGTGLRPDGTSPDALRAAVEQVLGDPSYRQNAESIGESFRRCSGAKGAADKILSVCKA